ncbi:S1C family serine protease [Haloferula helveola]
MRAALLLPLLFLAGCERPTATSAPQPAPTTAPVEVEETAPEFDPTASVVRINSTRQGWNPGQPWEKNSPRKRRSLGAVVGDGKVLTTSEMVADATYVELETTDGRKLAPAKVAAVDYEANLALLSLEDPEDDFFAELTAVEIADPAKPGDELQIVQVENNGTPLVTRGPVQSLDIISNFLPGQFFLAYEVKASMQNSASSFTLPVFRDDKLAGLLTSYNSKDQLSDVTATDIVRRFIDDAADGSYEGFPSLGVSTSSTDDSNFRKWLKLPDEVGGVYVSSVRKDSGAEKAGLKEGDVVVGVDGHDIDQLGYYDDPDYGRLFWSHLVRGSKAVGETVELRVMRQGEPVTIEAILERRDNDSALVPAYTFDKAPNFLVKGGLVFQELSRPLLEAFGDEWQSRAPLELLDVLENPEKYEEKADRVVFLAGVIATPATVGYESLRNLIVSEVNGVEVRDMESLIKAFDNVPGDGLNAINFASEDFTVYLDEVVSTAVDGQLLERGLSRLSRSDEK